MKQILFIIGSTRKHSFNRQLAQQTAAYLEGKADVQWLDFSDVPFLNQDDEFPAPPAVAAARKAVQAADGLWIFAPEYNYSYPGYLKNLIDWLSRPLDASNMAAGTAAKGKKVTVSGVSGKSAAQGSRTKLAELLNFIGMNVYGGLGEGFSLTVSDYKTDDLTLPPDDLARLHQQADAFLQFLDDAAPAAPTA
jgi:NAD(P)H-dependent FMN reductase